MTLRGEVGKCVVRSVKSQLGGGKRGFGTRHPPIDAAAFIDTTI